MIFDLWTNVYFQLQAGASTIFCILPLLFIQSYNTSVFVCAIVLVVGWGLLHGEIQVEK